MKSVRDELLQRREVARADLSLSDYWALRRSEDRFQAERREPIGVLQLTGEGNLIRSGVVVVL